MSQINCNKTNIYKNSIKSKTNIDVVVFKNDMTFYSKYNPERDADTFCSDENFTKAGFICIGGIGNGYHLERLAKKYPEKMIFAFEINSSSLEFLENNTSIYNLKKYSNIWLTSLENLKKDLINIYKPAIHNNFYFTTVRSWSNFNKDSIKSIEEEIKNAINIISSDYSVQARFGKIWMKNILENLQLSIENEISIPLNKPAAIVAAGPSLDKTINQLKGKSFYIIATDTALPCLIENNIIPQVVVSIDPQIYSMEHFTGRMNCLKDTIFLLDLCTNHNIAKSTIDKRNILFFSNGHPFISYIEKLTDKKFLNLNTGRGTVTSAAFSFADKCGFKDIVFFGSDFSFYNRKAYSKGTYLDKQFATKSVFFNNFETQHCKLMFRGNLIKNKSDIFTTPLLSEYCEYQQIMNSESKNQIYNSLSQCNPLKLKVFNKEMIDIEVNENPKLNKTVFFNPFIDKSVYKTIIEKLEKTKNFSSDDLCIALLPYTAWCNTKKIDFFSMINLAKNLIRLYTI